MDKRKINWVAWNQTMADQSAGGLGIGSLKALNNALLCKWWWRILTEKNSLWGEVITAIHGKYGGIGDRILNGKCPGSWKSILKVNSELEKHNLVFSSLFQLDLGDASNEKEEWTWKLSSSGLYTVSSFRRAFDDLYLPSLNTSFTWIKTVPRKVNVLVWRILHRRLPSKVNLEKRGVQVGNTNCPICNLSEEKEEHTFFDCYVAKELIKFIGKWWQLDTSCIDCLDAFIDWPRLVGLNEKKGEFLLGAIYTCLWIIWKIRNDVIFRGKDVKELDYIPMQLAGMSFFWIKHRSKERKTSLQWMEWNESPWIY